MSQEKVRKSISNLTTPEKEQYFLLVRLLHIFTPKDSEAFPFRYNSPYSQNKNKGTVRPKCLYDCLVSFHANSCEHGFEFFVYWHRWLTRKYEMYLEQCSVNILDDNYLEEQSKSIYNLMHSDRKSKTSVKAIRDLLASIKRDYQNIANQLRSIRAGDQKKYIACHYWDLFSKTSNIKYPDEYVSQTSRSERYKSADLLIAILWDQDGIYEVNFKYRYGYDPMTTKAFFSIQQRVYEQYKKILADKKFWRELGDQKSSTRINEIDDFIRKFQSNFLRYHQYEQRSSEIQKVIGTLHAYLDPRKIKLNVFAPDFVAYIFTGPDYPYYNNIYDRPDFNDPLWRLKDFRNRTTGLLDYCRSLKTKPSEFMTRFCTRRQQEYLEFSMETCHNKLHNSQLYTMSDGSFSIINPIFFAYHGLIDMMLEYRINTFVRQGVDDVAAEGVTWFLNKEMPKISERFDDRNVFRSKWADYFAKKSGRATVFGDYPILSFISPDFDRSSEVTDKDFVAASEYTYKQLLLTQSTKPRLKTLQQLANITFQNLLSSQFAKTVQVTKTLDPVVRKSSMAVERKSRMAVERIALETIPQKSIQFSKPGFVADSAGPQLRIQRFQQELQEKFSVSLAAELRLPPTSMGENIFVDFKDLQGNILYTTIVSIFRRGGQNGNCPNCKQFEKIVVSVPIQQLGDIIKKALNYAYAKRKGKKGGAIGLSQYSDFDLNIPSKLGVEVNQFFRTQIRVQASNPEVHGHIITGRKNAKIVVPGYSQPMINNKRPQQKEMEQFLLVQQSTNRLKTNVVSQGLVQNIILDLNPQTGAYQKEVKFGNKEFNIIGIMGNSKKVEDHMEKFEFPLFCEYGKVVLNELQLTQSLPGSKGSAGIQKHLNIVVPNEVASQRQEGFKDAPPLILKASDVIS